MNVKSQKSANFVAGSAGIAQEFSLKVALARPTKLAEFWRKNGTPWRDIKIRGDGSRKLGVLRSILSRTNQFCPAAFRTEQAVVRQ